MVENGRKWWKMVENGRKKVHRGYLVGNGFPRVLRHGHKWQEMAGNGRKWVAAVIW